MITIIISDSMRIEKDSNLVGDAETKAGLHHHCVGRVRTEPGHLSIIVVIIVLIIFMIVTM